MKIIITETFEKSYNNFFSKEAKKCGIRLKSVE